MENDQAFGAVYKSFDDVWPDDKKERRRIELLKPSFTRTGNALWYNGKRCVPRRAVRQLLNLSHDGVLAGHFGFTKTLGRLEKFHWKGKTRDVREYCGGCATCQQQKDSGGADLK